MAKYKLSRYVAERIRENGNINGGNFYVFINSDQAIGRTQTEITTGVSFTWTDLQSYNPLDFTDFEVTNVYTNWLTMRSQIGLTTSNIIIAGTLNWDSANGNNILSNRLHYVYGEFGSLINNINATNIIVGQEIQGYSTSGRPLLYNLRITGLGTFYNQGYGGAAIRPLVIRDCTIDINASSSGVCILVAYNTLFSKNTSNTAISIGSTILGSGGGSSSNSIRFNNRSPSEDLKLIFTDYDNGDYTLNPDPQYVSPITVAWGYKTETSTTAIYNAGENPFIRPDGTIIGALGIGFPINFATGATVPTGLASTADSILTLGSNLTRSVDGVTITSESGTVTTNNQILTPVMFVRYKNTDLFTTIQRKLNSFGISLAPDEFITCEMRVGITNNLSSESWIRFELDTDIYSENFSIRRDLKYFQLRITLGRW